MVNQRELNNLQNHIDVMNSHYDPEHNIIPDTPPVTYTDHELLEMIQRLTLMVKDLQSQINWLKGQ